MEACPSFLLHDAAIHHNRQCLLTYHGVARLQKLLAEVNVMSKVTHE